MKSDLLDGVEHFFTTRELEIDKNISLADLKGTLEIFAKKLEYVEHTDQER